MTSNAAVMARRSSMATAANATLRRAVIGAFSRVRGELWSTSDLPSSWPLPAAAREQLADRSQRGFHHGLHRAGSYFDTNPNSTGGVDGDLVDHVTRHRGRAGHRGGRPLRHRGKLSVLIGGHQLGQHRGHRAHPIGHGVGELHHDDQPAVGETLDNPGVPQRAITVQGLRVQLVNQRGQLTHRARLRQSHMMQMVVDRERRVLDQYRLAQPKGFGEQPLAETLCRRSTLSRRPCTARAVNSPRAAGSQNNAASTSVGITDVSPCNVTPSRPVNRFIMLLHITIRAGSSGLRDDSRSALNRSTDDRTCHV